MTRSTDAGVENAITWALEAACACAGELLEAGAGWAAGTGWIALAVEDVATTAEVAGEGPGALAAGAAEAALSTGCELASGESDGATLLEDGDATIRGELAGDETASGKAEGVGCAVGALGADDGLAGVLATGASVVVDTTGALAAPARASAMGGS